MRRLGFLGFIFICLLAVNVYYWPGFVTVENREIELLYSGDPVCSAYSISEDSVMTARHCVEGRSPESLQLRDHTSGALFSITSKHYPDTFSAFPQGDQAILKLVSPMEGYRGEVLLPFGMSMFFSIKDGDLIPLTYIKDFTGPRLKNMILLESEEDLIGPGDSGRPIFRIIDDKATVVGMIQGSLSRVSKRGESTRQFLGSRLPIWGLVGKHEQANEGESKSFKDLCLQEFNGSPQWAEIQSLLLQIINGLKLSQKQAFHLMESCEEADTYLNRFHDRGLELTFNGLNYDSSKDYSFVKGISRIRFVGLNPLNKKYLQSFSNVRHLEIVGVQRGMDLSFLKEFKKLRDLTLEYAQNVVFPFEKSLSRLKLIGVHFRAKLDDDEILSLRNVVDCPTRMIRHGLENDPLLLCI